MHRIFAHFQSEFIIHTRLCIQHIVHAICQYVAHSIAKEGALAN